MQYNDKLVKMLCDRNVNRKVLTYCNFHGDFEAILKTRSHEAYGLFMEVNCWYPCFHLLLYMYMKRP